MKTLDKSTFGVFFKRRFSRYEQYLKDDNAQTPSTKQIVSLVMKKLFKTSKEKRSAYRWETFDYDVKKELVDLAPVNKADLMTAATQETHDGTKKPVAKEPAYAFCGQKAAASFLAGCPCRAVKYCKNGECQLKDWPSHKRLCRKLRWGN